MDNIERAGLKVTAVKNSWLDILRRLSWNPRSSQTE